jgi:hypothetical protein
VGHLRQLDLEYSITRKVQDQGATTYLISYLSTLQLIKLVMELDLTLRNRVLLHQDRGTMISSWEGQLKLGLVRLSVQCRVHLSLLRVRVQAFIMYK